MTNNRELVPIEQAMEILNRRASSYHVVTISCIQGALSEEIVRQALDLIQCRHPRLNCCIIGESDSLRFEGGAMKIPLRVVECVHKQQWQEVVLAELNQKFESDKGLMRAVLVRFENETDLSYLITTVHHAICDGLSCVQLQSEVLTYYQRIAAGESITQVPSLSALPPLPELLPKSMKGFRGFINGIFFLLLLKWQQILHRPETLGFEKSVPAQLRCCGMVHRKLDVEITQQLVNLCRQEKTTVQCALCAAMMLAVASKITGEKRTNVRLSCRSYVDLRKRLHPTISNENMGVLASAVTSYHTTQMNTSFWDLARDVKQQLEAILESKRIFSPVLVFKQIVNSFLTHPYQVPVTVAVSNIGRVNIPETYGVFKLEEVSFVPAQALFGGVFAAAVSTFNDKMLLNFMFSEPSISRETIEELASNTISRIVEACYQDEEDKTFTLTK